MREVGSLDGGQAADFMLEDLQGCRIEIKGCLSAIRMRNVSNCFVKAGPIQGSAFLEGVRFYQDNISDLHLDSVFKFSTLRQRAFESRAFYKVSTEMRNDNDVIHNALHFLKPCYMQDRGLN